MTMRHRNIGAVVLALALTLALVELGRGQQPTSTDGNWFSRLFGRTAPVPEPKEEKTVPVVSRAAVLTQAKADFLRRLEVCDKLRDIALQNNDSELLNRVEQLQTRAKDAYIQRTNHVGSTSDSFDEQTLARNLAPKGASLTPLTATAGKSSGSHASAEGGR
jgi:hypothetical protein